VEFRDFAGESEAVVRSYNERLARAVLGRAIEGSAERLHWIARDAGLNHASLCCCVPGQQGLSRPAFDALCRGPGKGATPSCLLPGNKE
jgi:hypothetical protein